MKERTSIGIDIGKRKCAVCVMDSSGAVLERTSYLNTVHDAREIASRLKRQYGSCHAMQHANRLATCGSRRSGPLRSAAYR